MSHDHHANHADHTGHDSHTGHDDHDVVANTAPVPVSGGGRLLALPVIAYRRWLSPALPARCRFYPSCSAYALEALARHGALRGTGLTVWRLLRCHPFHPGGYDPVPPGDRDATGAAR